MGSFFGSIQVRGCPRDRVKAAVEAVAAARNLNFLLGPELQGWIGIYPEHSGQDDSVGAEIASRVGAIVLQLVVHDDDVMTYRLWKESVLVDSFFSLPGYFGERGREEEEAMRGNPQVLAEAAGGDPSAIAPLLQRGAASRRAFEGSRLKRLSGLLGIANTTTSYEYLMAGERQGIRQWRKFQEVPDTARREAAERRKALANAKQAAKKRDLLLVDARKSLFGFRACARVSAERDGFVVAWWRPTPREVAYEHHAPPWTTPAPCAREPDWPAIFGHSTEAAGLRAGVTTDSVLITRVADGTEFTRLPRPAGNFRLAIHPSGSWLWTSSGCLAKLPWRRAGYSPEWSPRNTPDSPWKWLDTQQAVSEEMLVATLDHSIDLQVLRRSPDLVNAAGDALGKALGRLPTDAERAACLDHLAQFSRRTSLSFAQSTREHVHVTLFSRDGRHLFLGTFYGIRVFDWQALLDAPECSAPKPIARFDILPIGPYRGGVCAIAELPGESGVVFGSFSGLLYYLTLPGGQVRHLDRFPAQGPVRGLCPAANGRFLAVVISPWFMKKPRGPREEDVVQVWSWDGLIAE